mmetsp:Transcript_120960/g.342200  ORF Transcript_120960/g.342200 Transcript_120960/m.342200 type:complete len:307 (+) Transcript_120960:84-1004(+)
MTLMAMANKKPRSAERPVTLPPCSKASGNTVLAIMQSIAPPQSPSILAMTFATTGSSALPGGNTSAPTYAPMAVVKVMDAHMVRMDIFLMPCAYIVPADDMASGKFARKTPQTKVRRVLLVAVFTRIPMTTLSGILSMRMPNQIIIAACTPRPWPEWPWTSSCPSPPFAALAFSIRSGRSWVAKKSSLNGSSPTSSSKSSSQDGSDEAQDVPFPLPLGGVGAPDGGASTSTVIGVWPCPSLTTSFVVLLRQPNSAKAPPNFDGADMPSGGTKSTGRPLSWAPTLPLWSTACRKRLSCSQSLSMSPR